MQKQSGRREGFLSAVLAIVLAVTLGLTPVAAQPSEQEPKPPKALSQPLGRRLVALDEPTSNNEPIRVAASVAAPPTRTVEIEQAVVEAVKGFLGEANVPLVIVANVVMEGAWAFGTAAVPPRMAEGAPEGFLFLAQQQEERWQVALSGQAEFEVWRNLAPEGIPLMRSNMFSA